MCKFTYTFIYIWIAHILLLLIDVHAFMHDVYSFHLYSCIQTVWEDQNIINSANCDCQIESRFLHCNFYQRKTLLWLLGMMFYSPQKLHILRKEHRSITDWKTFRLNVAYPNSILCGRVAGLWYIFPLTLLFIRIMHSTASLCTCW